MRLSSHCVQYYKLEFKNIHQICVIDFAYCGFFFVFALAVAAAYYYEAFVHLFFKWWQNYLQYNLWAPLLLLKKKKINKIKFVDAKSRRQVCNYKYKKGKIYFCWNVIQYECVYANFKTCFYLFVLISEYML